MNILFVTFGPLSAGAGAIRSVSLLRALADAGYRVDVIASQTDFGAHDNIHIICGDGARPVSRRKLRMEAVRAVGRKKYSVIHAVDDAVLTLYRLNKVKRSSALVYEATRCFSGKDGDVPSRYWRLFPNHCRRVEQRMLERASLVFCACDELSTSLKRKFPKLPVAVIEDVPVQSLFCVQEVDREEILAPFSGGASFIGVCSVLPGSNAELRTLLLGIRKVLEKIPGGVFFFKGVNPEKAAAMAANLEIETRCRFLLPEQEKLFLSVLSVADAALFVPVPGRCYMHPEVLSLLNSPALVVAVSESAYSTILSEQNSIQVHFTAQSIAEGLLKVIGEPLLALGMVSEARRMISDRYSFSSFKHKVRMAYHELTKIH